jgi:serine/threonine-protein kinase BUR1
VGMGPNSGWATNSGPRPATDSRNSRIPGAARGGRLHAHGNQSHPTKRPFESRNAVSHGSLNAGDSIPGFSLGSKDGGLPPKPPASARQSWTMGHSNRATRERGQRNHFGGWPDGKLDSYVPTYSDTSEHSQERKGNSPSSIVGRRDLELEQSNEGYKQGHSWDRYASRRRSRSPDFRAARTEDRALYRR